MRGMVSVILVHMTNAISLHISCAQQPDSFLEDWECCTHKLHYRDLWNVPFDDLRRRGAAIAVLVSRELASEIAWSGGKLHGDRAKIRL